MAGRTQEEILRLLFETEGEQDIAATAKLLLDLGKAADASGTKARGLLEELQKLGSTADGIAKFTKLKGEIAETGTRIVETSGKLATLRREIDASAAPNDKLAKSFDKTQAELDKLMRLQNRQSVELTKTGHALRAAGVDTGKLGEAYDELRGKLGAVGSQAAGLAAGVKRVGDEQGKAAGSAARLKKATDDAGVSIGNLTTRFAKVGAAAVAASAALVGFGGARLFKGAMGSALEFEQAISQVAAVSGATGAELEALKAAAEEGGLATKFSALQAAEGLGELARATGDSRTAIAALPATLNLAQAAGLGVAEAAQFITTTLTQFGLEAAEAGRVADVLAQAANASTADVQGLGNALTYAAPLAKQLGLDLEETTAVIAALADQGFRGERAGTALRNVFTEMQDPASEFGRALRDLGIDTSSFSEMLGEISEGGPRAQKALLKLDAAARPAILALVNGGVAGLGDLEAALRSAEGQAARTAQVMNDNAGGAIEHLTDVYDKAKRDFVEPLLEPLRDELDALSEEIKAFAESPEFSELKGAFKELFSEGADAAREFLSETDFKKLAQDIRTFVDDSRKGLAEFQESVRQVTDVLSVLGNTVELVFGTVKTALTASAASVATLLSAITGAADALSAPARKIAEVLGLSTEGFDKLHIAAEGLKGATTGAWESTVEGYKGVVETFGEFSDVVDGAADSSAAGLEKTAGAAATAADASAALAGAAHDAADGLEAEGAAADAAAGKVEAAATEAEAAAARIALAFEDLGIKSRKDLDETASAARRNFQLIADAARDGQRPVDDVRAAFVAYGQAALEAVKHADASVQARVAGELAVQAAANGVTGALVDLGLRGEEAGHKVASGARAAAGPLQDVESTARGAAAATQSIADGAAAGAGGLRAMGAAAGTTRVAVFQLNEALLEAFAGLSRKAGTSAFVSGLNQITSEMARQQAVVAELNAELDSQFKKLDPLADELEKLRSQYKFVDDATLRALAEKQAQLKREREAAAQERREARQERNQLAAETSAAAAEPAQASRGAAAASGAVAAGGGTVITLRLVLDGHGSYDLPVGQGGEIDRFMRDLANARSVATGGR